MGGFGGWRGQLTSSWMLVAGFLFATMGVFVKLGAEHFGAAEMAMYRSLFSLLWVLAIVALKPGATLRTSFAAAHVMRGLVGSVSLIGYFYAITRLPLATAQTLNYTSPIFLAIATTVVLRERFSSWLLVAIVLGFAGVGILLQPTFETGSEGPAVVGLLSGVFSAWAYLSVRTLGRLGEPDCGTLAQLAMTRAYRTGVTLVVGAFSYSTVLFATVFTILVWHERIGVLEVAGMAVIAASGVLAMRVEKREQVEEAGFES
jgi:drug/metabolite transporter (DMT)-like permease